MYSKCKRLKIKNTTFFVKCRNPFYFSSYEMLFLSSKRKETKKNKANGKLKIKIPPSLLLCAKKKKENNNKNRQTNKGKTQQICTSKNCASKFYLWYRQDFKKKKMNNERGERDLYFKKVRVNKKRFAYHKLGTEFAEYQQDYSMKFDTNIKLDTISGIHKPLSKYLIQNIDTLQANFGAFHCDLA
ncbi:hypothetical protein RFI_31423 [Reticulomyxa filosa]|uniref:Uncharacterized protein n=1 Tax=Reticulomyxa filosa TaxID=46433 RepID=X6LXV9_RETFI|nr:hypothetical protein RFI_31423 [Reticulomyxa filosa]|eukprot:ETO05977.1 hypothetical protein RFI_31423 [Reticulomyxa filosa]